MPKRSTTEAILVACQVMEKYREKRNPYYRAFLELKKTYDRLLGRVLERSPRERCL